MFDHEVIVVGCGPAGLMACRELKKRGIDVAGIDIKVRLDKVYRAATGFFLAEQDFNGDYIHVEPKRNKTLLTWERNGFSYLYPAKILPIYRSHLVSNGGRHYTMTAVKKPFMYNFDPTTWIRGLYEEALSLGVTFYPETMLLNAREIQSGMEIDIRKGGRRAGSMTCRILVGADGISSRTAKSLGMNRGRPLLGRGPSAEYEIENVKPPFPDGDIYVFGKNNLGMEAHVFMVPRVEGRERSFRMTTIAPSPAVKNRDVLEFLTTKGQLRHWFKDAHIISKHAAIMEMYTAMKVPCKGNAIFLGDAAAMAESLYAGATMCGYAGAIAVAKELNGEDGFAEYIDWWNNRAFEMTNDMKKMAEYVKRMLFNAWMGPDVMDKLFELAEKSPLVVDEFIGNPYGYARTIIEHLQTVPGIKPEWKERLEQMKSATLEDFIRIAGAV